MSYIYWSDEYRVGVEELDGQHKSLFELMNELITLFEYEEAHKSFSNKLNELVKYAESHFTLEEDYLKKIKYPNLREHQRKHELLVMRIFKLAEKNVTKNYDTLALVKFLREWLCVHIKVEDMLYKKYSDSVIEEG